MSFALSSLLSCLCTYIPDGYPRITDIPQARSIVTQAGYPLTIRCTVSGYPVPTALRYKNNKPVDVQAAQPVWNTTDELPLPWSGGKDRIQVISM